MFVILIVYFYYYIFIVILIFMWDPTGKNATNVLKFHAITLFLLFVLHKGLMID
jgi:hypothetical protein